VESVVARNAGTEVRVACPFCTADDAETLLRHERYGSGMPTVICRQCSLIYVGRRFLRRGLPSPRSARCRLEELYARQLVKTGEVIAFCGPCVPGEEGAVLDVGASVGGVVRGLGRATGCSAVLTYYTSETLRDLIQRLGFQAVRWRAPTAEEALRRHRDEREHVGPVLAVQGLFRVEDNPVLFARPDWRRIKADFDATRRRHERPPLVRRLARRIAGLDFDS
jgi:hypothetical protein